MLSLNVSIRGDKIVLEGLESLSADMPRVIQRGLSKVAKGVHRSAMDFLNGPGGFNSYETKTSKKTGRQYQKKTGSKVEDYVGFTKASGEPVGFRRFTDSGGYPVPVRTGNLRRLLNFVEPGQSKGEFTAGPQEAVVYDSALYSRAIHQGTGSSAKFGKRPFLDDALAKFNGLSGISKVIDAEIASEIQKRGLRS